MKTMRRWMMAAMVLVSFCGTSVAEENTPKKYDSEGLTIGIGLPFGINLGYQFNPFITASADFWTILLASAAEAQVRVNVVDDMVSPYLLGSVGRGSAVNIGEYEDGSTGFTTFSLGGGLDIHLGRRAKLYFNIRYRQLIHDDEAETFSYPEPNLGVRWTF